MKYKHPSPHINYTHPSPHTEYLHPCPHVKYKHLFPHIKYTHQALDFTERTIKFGLFMIALMYFRCALSDGARSGETRVRLE